MRKRRLIEAKMLQNVRTRLAYLPVNRNLEADGEKGEFAPTHQMKTIQAKNKTYIDI